MNEVYTQGHVSPYLHREGKKTPNQLKVVQRLVWRHGASTQLQNMPNSAVDKLTVICHRLAAPGSSYTVSATWPSGLRQIKQSSRSKHTRVWRCIAHQVHVYFLSTEDLHFPSALCSAAARVRRLDSPWKTSNSRWWQNIGDTSCILFLPPSRLCKW